jgi:hypothetical protein
MSESPVLRLADLWRTEAERLERFAPAAAVAFRDAAAQLETAIRAEADEVLTLTEAAMASGHSVDHLRHLVAAGVLHNAGRKGAPRVRRSDLPKKTRPVSQYDVNADARRLAGVRR